MRRKQFLSGFVSVSFALAMALQPMTAAAASPTIGSPAPAVKQSTVTKTVQAKPIEAERSDLGAMSAQQSYAERERAAQSVANFQGGDVAVISISAGAAAIALLILILLIID